MLQISIHFARGRFSGMRTLLNGEQQADWPPQPLRLFKGLVSAAGKVGLADPRIRSALLALEQAPPPVILSPRAAHVVSPLTQSCPPNGRKLGSALEFTQEGVVYDENIMVTSQYVEVGESPLIYVWDLDGEHAGTVASLAARMSYFGRSDSHISMYIEEVGSAPHAPDHLVHRPIAESSTDVLACPHSGTLKLLEDLFERPSLDSSMQKLTPLAWRDVVYADDSPRRAPGWLVFNMVDEFGEKLRLPVTDTVRFTEKVHETLGISNDPYLVGRDGDGPLKAEHLSIAPLPDMRVPSRRGGFSRFALIPLNGGEREFTKALRAKNILDGRTIWLSASRGITLEWDEGGSKRTFREWSCRSRTWESATPVKLEYKAKKRMVNAVKNAKILTEKNAALDALELHEKTQVEQMLEKAGIKTEGVWFYSSAPGVPDERKFNQRAKWSGAILKHVRFVTKEPTGGPVLLGLGRYFGLGIFYPRN